MNALVVLPLGAQIDNGNITGRVTDPSGAVIAGAKVTATQTDTNFESDATTNGEGIYRLLHSDYAQPVNIGNPDEITIRQFGEEIIKLTGTDQQMISLPLPTDDPKQRRPDITKAKSILGWEPKVSRSEGLKITYEYFKSLPEKEIQNKDFTYYNK